MPVSGNPFLDFSVQAVDLRPECPAEVDGADLSASQRRRLGKLLGTIEGEIIPRLMLLHGVRHPEPGGGPAQESPPRAVSPPLGEAAVAHLADLVLSGDVFSPSAYVRRLLDEGVPTQTLLLDLLAPTARHLGELWADDLCDFAAVTIGLCHLHRILQDLSRGTRPTGFAGEGGPRILLCPAQGEQHTFGLAVVMELLRRAGWNVWGRNVCTVDEMNGLLGDQARLKKQHNYLEGELLDAMEALETAESELTSE